MDWTSAVTLGIAGDVCFWKQALSFGFGKRRKASRREARSKEMWWENSRARVSGDPRSWVREAGAPRSRGWRSGALGTERNTPRKCTCASRLLVLGGATLSASQPLASPAVVFLCTRQLAAAACDLGAGVGVAGGGGGEDDIPCCQEGTIGWKRWRLRYSVYIVCK